MSIRDGIDLAVSALEYASRDIYTGGLDVVAITPKGIIEGKNLIRKSINDAKGRAIRDIKRRI